MRALGLILLFATLALPSFSQTSENTAYTLNVKALHSDTLMRHCGNILEFSVPELGHKFEPYFMVMGGTYRMGAHKGEVVIVPDNSKVMVKVYNRNTYVGQKIFVVQNVPAPKLEVFDEHVPVTPGGSISVEDLGHLDVKVKPEEGFAEDYPKDAKYRVTEFDVSLIRDGKEIEHAHFEKFHGNISSWKAKAHEGDQLKIEIKEVQRKTFMHKSEKVYNVTREMICNVS